MRFATNLFVWAVGIRLLDILISIYNLTKIGVWLELFTPFNFAIGTKFISLGINLRTLISHAQKGSLAALALLGIGLILVLFSELLLLRIGITSWWGRIIFNLTILFVLTIAFDYAVFGSWDAGQSLLIEIR